MSAYVFLMWIIAKKTCNQIQRVVIGMRNHITIINVSVFNIVILVELVGFEMYVYKLLFII